MFTWRQNNITLLPISQTFQFICNINPQICKNQSKNPGYWFLMLSRPNMAFLARIRRLLFDHALTSVFYWPAINEFFPLWDIGQDIGWRSRYQRKYYVIIINAYLSPFIKPFNSCVILRFLTHDSAASLCHAENL